ncbi:tRNA pseudouridine synthase A [Mucilaginibacter ginsenosidivorax]|uniref:tRNA pseudouridine synthase A n=1 Tax=Mucilaginibacter ginsenosidivorax TaxID=862126 RepID=A0A5B8WAF0_9SPHI|nr:tRNA pseudouridine synthase A [Mucilaginibacter ginsenosidivorax]QEC79905.1 tRNA pseudouridine synthase A [Mucilaginibacter ginsenosidivorax]
MRYFFHIGYHGTQYSGWQKHAGVVSVQAVFETALSQILKTPITVNGCGRTDAQVHASQFFFHIDVVTEWDFDLLFRLNKILPDDIAVFDIIPMQGLPHARFDAVQRSYDYFIHTYKDPFLSAFSALYPETNLHIDEMKKAAALLPLYNDYRAFCKMPDRIDHTICNVSSASLAVSTNGDRLRFNISANRFLSKMIRIIIGRLLEIGRGEMSVDEFESHLISKHTPQIIIPAYPQGLYLSKVTYPYLDIPAKPTFTGLLQKDESVVWQPLSHQ